MRAFALFLLLAACTVPPAAPLKEEPARETGYAEAPPEPPAPAPPTPKPHKPPPASTAKTEPPPAPVEPCPAPVNPKKRILQELDCLIIKIEETKPK